MRIKMIIIPIKIIMTIKLKATVIIQKQKH